jgi:hypothetical protein
VKEDTNSGLSPRQLARLLATGVEGVQEQKNPGSNRSPEEILRKMLSGELPLDAAIPDSLPVVLNWPSDQVLAAAGRSMSDLLLNSSTDLTVLKTLKDYAKELARRREPEAKQAAATVLYYAAIAGALVFHEQRITEHSYRKLYEAYDELEGTQWIPRELKDLFKKARTVCQGRKENLGSG